MARLVTAESGSSPSGGEPDMIDKSPVRYLETIATFPTRNFDVSSKRDYRSDAIIDTGNWSRVWRV